MQGRASGPGYLTSLGTEPPLCTFTDSSLIVLITQRRGLRVMRRQRTAASRVTEGPGESELVPAWAPLARLLSNQVRPHFLEMRNVPI